MSRKSKSRTREKWIAPNAAERELQKKLCRYKNIFLDPDRLAFPIAPAGSCTPSNAGKRAARQRLLMNIGAARNLPGKYKSRGLSYKTLLRRAKKLGIMNNN